jgi:DNA-directed RNA polymerase specialized sigma24 family protein
MKKAVTNEISSDAVAAYLPHIRNLARRFVGIANAELDDLVQEGMVSVWQAMSRGLTPSTLVIIHRMNDWVRYLRRLERGDAVAYEVMLPIESYALETR